MTPLIPKDLLLIAVVCYILVLLAMIVDLIAGLYKAKIRGDIRTSEMFKRTGYKFITYIGCMFIATFMDVMLSYCHVFRLIGIDALDSAPPVTILVGIFWCLVEFLSVREKADEKVHSNIARAERLARDVLSKEQLTEILAEAFRKAMNNKTDPTP